MKIGETGVEISGISRIVIDKTHVWDRDKNNGHFEKTSGGPGFHARKVISIAKMSKLVAKEMARVKYIGNGEFSERIAWFKEGTLNIKWD